MAGAGKELTKQEKYRCRYYGGKTGCFHLKTESIKIFLRSINAIGKTFVDSNKWSSEEWQQYHEAMSKLPNGTDGCNLPTGIVACDWDFIPGSNPLCDDWDCPGRRTHEESKAKNPHDLIIIR
jgi:hypothetical protein